MKAPLTSPPMGTGFCKIRFDPYSHMKVTNGGSMTLNSTVTAIANNLRNSKVLPEAAGSCRACNWGLTFKIFKTHQERAWPDPVDNTIC